MWNRKSLKQKTGAAIAVTGVTLLLGLSFAAAPASAQTAALPRADVVEQLDAQYAEAQAAVGVTQHGGVVEVFASEDGSAWTLVLTEPNGTSRVIAAGETWIRRAAHDQ